MPRWPAEQASFGHTLIVSRCPDRRPVWLLDVDGVLNAARPGWGDEVQQGQAFVDGAGYRLRWAPQLVRRITGLVYGGAVEVRWATTWVDHIVQVERLFRLPPLATAFQDLDPYDDPEHTCRVKLEAALAVVEGEGRPLIWTDDDAIPRSGPQRRRLREAGVPVLLLSPSSRHGLQPEDLEEIDDFVARFSLLAG